MSDLSELYCTGVFTKLITDRWIFKFLFLTNKQCHTLKNKSFIYIPGNVDPEPPLLSHSWHVLSCRYLALTAVEIFVLFLESAESSADKQKISKSTQYICRVTQRRDGEGGAELKVSVNLDCQGMPGGASIPPLPFIKTRKRGENAATALCKFCIS